MVQEVSDTRTSGRFYVLVVQYVLIFGLTSWVITPRILQALGSLHNWVARRVSGRMPWFQNVKWEYSSIGEAVVDVGLGKIGGYIPRLHNSVVHYIATQPIFTFI